VKKIFDCQLLVSSYFCGVVEDVLFDLTCFDKIFKNTVDYHEKFCVALCNADTVCFVCEGAVFVNELEASVCAVAVIYDELCRELVCYNCVKLVALEVNCSKVGVGVCGNCSA